MKRLFVLSLCSLLFVGCGKKGCTDSYSSNYDSKAKKDDGSCQYPDTTYLPDQAFEQRLIDIKIDTILDGFVLTRYINEITGLSVSSCNITDLTGIEDFTSLITLNCFHNPLTNLNLSENINLEYLYCRDNQLTNLDVSGCNSLINLWCESNQLTSLDLSNNPALIDLNCDENQLTSLDVTQNTALTKLFCQSNQLTSLNLSENTALIRGALSNNELTCLNLKNGVVGRSINLYITPGNNNLTCVEVDDPTNIYFNIYNPNQWTYSTNCNYPAGCF